MSVHQGFPREGVKKTIDALSAEALFREALFRAFSPLFRIVALPPQCHHNVAVRLGCVKQFPVANRFQRRVPKNGQSLPCQ